MTATLARAETVFLALNRWAVILTLAAMSCIVFANVTLRYLTNESIVWAEEVARYLMVYMTFLAAGLALRAGLLVSVSHVHMRLPPRLGAAARLIILAALAIFCGWMILSGLDYVARMGRQLTPATRVSFGHVYRAMPLGFGLLLIHILLVARRYAALGRFDETSGDHASAASG